MTTTIDDIREILKKLAQSQQELNQSQQELSQAQKETDRQIKSVSKPNMTACLSLNYITKNFHHFGKFFAC